MTISTRNLNNVVRVEFFDKSAKTKFDHKTYNKH